MILISEEAVAAGGSGRSVDMMRSCNQSRPSSKKLRLEVNVMSDKRY